jgi:large subunit ribosomal protein L1
MRQNIRTKPHSPRYVAAAATIDKTQLYDIDTAITLVKSSATTAKLKESIDLSLRLGIDPKKNDQNVRGITNLPHGTGKKRKVAVLAKGQAAIDAEQAGADEVGAEELIAKIQGGYKDFDTILASDEMAPQIGKIGRALGPKTPNKRNGTVTNNVAAAVREIKAATRVEYRAEKAGIVHMCVGKVSFTDEQIKENFKAALGAILRAKPATAKGKYLISATLSSTMGPGVPLDTNLASKFAG